MKKGIKLLLSITILCLYNTVHSQEKETREGDNTSAEIYYKNIQKAEQRIQEIGSMQYIENPKNEDEYRKNDSLMSIAGIAIDALLKSLVDAYGNIPTDSILIRLQQDGGYIPPALTKKMQASDWSTKIGKAAKKNQEQFFKYYEQFENLVGLSLCDSKIMLKSAEGEKIGLCEILSNGIYLVDIWASWCSPCRKFNRDFKKSYVYFKNQGIETISVSTDEDLKSYQLAVMKDNVPWSDFNDYTGKLSETLNIQSLPFQFIVKDKKIKKILIPGDTKTQLREYLKSIKK